MRTPLLAALALALALPASAIAQSRTLSVEITGSGDGSASDRLVFLVKEKFRSSPTFKVTRTGEMTGYHLHLVSLEGSAPFDGGLLYSAAITQTDLGAAIGNPDTSLEHYMTSIVGYCGSRVIEVCADRIFASAGAALDQNAEAMSTVLKGALDSLKAKKP